MAGDPVDVGERKKAQRGGSGKPPGEPSTRWTISRLLRDLAASPPEPHRDAWDHGLAKGQVIDGRYVLGPELGHGGFGVVLRAHDSKLGRPVALKAVPSGGQSDSAMLDEAKICARLEHENLVRLYDSGRFDSGLYLVLELLEGETLETRLKRGALQPVEAVKIALDVAQALVYAHRQGVLHRDLKPANVFITRDGRTKVLDFGLAHYFLLDSREGTLGADVVGPQPRGGTPGYMAPEQARGTRQDARTDVFAVGKLLQQMLSGKHPWALGWRLPRDLRNRRDLEGLIDRAIDPDPARRLPDAKHLRDELTALQKRFASSYRKNVVVLALVVSALVAGAVGGVKLRELKDRPDAVLVAVADIDNQTGDADLNGLSSLLSTSLQQWPRMTVLTRDRMLGLAPGAGGSGRVDCNIVLVAAEAARVAVGRGAGVPNAVALCSEVDRSSTGFTVQVEAIDVPHSEGKRKFVLAESASSKEEIGKLVDRLSADIHRRLGPLGELGPTVPARPIESQTTGNLEAHQHYFSGLQCTDLPAHGLDCSQHFRKALELDPNFALAAYELAVWLSWNGGSLAEQHAMIERAERLADRVPEKEKTLIHAWAAHLDRDDARALQLLDQVSKSWPQDKRAFYQVGDILRHRDELAAAIPWFEKAIDLEPDFPWAVGDLARVLGALGRTEQLRTWAGRWNKSARVGTLHGLSIARGWLGDIQGAVDAAQQAYVMGAGPSAQEDLLQAKLFAGEYAVVEAVARQITARATSNRRLAYYGLAALEAYQGRPRAGLSRLDELAREIPEVDQDGLYRMARADYLVGMGDSALVWVEAQRARGIDPRLAAEHAVSLAYLGDFEHAAELARDLPRATMLARTYEALVRMRGDFAGGLEALRTLSSSTPIFAWRLSPLFIYGERLAAAGRCEEAVEVLRRAQGLYVPVAMWRSWAYPRSLYLLAGCLDRLGRREEAQVTLKRFLRHYSRAEAGAPYLREGLALHARLWH